MLRIISILLDILSGLFAILAPIAVVHWILGAFEIQAMAGVIGFFTGIFKPFNYVIDAIMPFELPMINYQGRVIPITQGILGFILTLCFFFCALGANVLRVLDKQMSVTTDIVRSKQRMRELEMARKETNRQVSQTNRVLVYLLFPFDNQRSAGNFFLGFKKYQGRQLSTRTEGWLLEFDDVELALLYATETAEKLLQYYGSLRPMDPQPPFHMSVHAVRPGGDFTFPGLEKCQLLIRYSGDNQIIFSQQVLELLRVNALAGNYKYQSLGFYDFPSDKNQEIFVLFYKKPEQKVYY
jgi:hypothetical protein